MILNEYDTLNVLKQFPNIKLSYVKTIHKKVYSANVYYLIPKGRKYFVWFKHFKNRDVCLFLEITRDNRIKEITIKNCCFKSELCFKQGTILYGTLFKKNNNNFFSIEDIYYYKNINLTEKYLQIKLENINDLFSNNIKQINISNNDVILGLPIMSTSRDAISKFLETPPYPLYCLQHRYNNNSNTYVNEKIINYSKIFLVKADITSDIYNLYLKDKYNRNIFYKNALIPNYKTSVFMNTIFRNIRENRNLDLLEESDDEDEFQDIKEDKYIINPGEVMICDYNLKYKLWVPREITTLNIDYKTEVINMEKNIN